MNKTAHVERAERCLVMGVLNVTPDSFSDGGRYLDTDAAVAHGMWMVEHGADIIDVGGESTRPGAEKVTDEQEQERVIPVIRALAQAGIRISVDTYRADTAAAAVAAGAQIVNDVSGGLADPNMHTTVAALGTDYVLQHWRGNPQTMNSLAVYDDCVVEVVAELTRQRGRALEAGIAADRIILDPGLGFAKETDHNWQLLGNLGRLTSLGNRVLVGASRKRFVAALLEDLTVSDDATNDPAVMANRDAVSALIATLSAAGGAWAVRAHDVIATRRAVAVAAAARRFHQD